MNKNESYKIFVVDDDDWYRDFLAHILSLNPDFEVKKFSNGKDFLRALNQNPDVVTIDYLLPDLDGESLLKEIKKQNPDIEAIVISEQGDVDTAVGLLKLGAYDYLVKADDVKERLLNIINNIRKNQNLKTRIVKLEQEVKKKYNFSESIIGKSEVLQNVFALVEKAAATNINVMITGETGTGKELIAKAIHYHSLRSKEAMVTINMAAIPKELAESELFGHEKGAFTGAANQRIGKFEQANNGTIFLDEIGELELSLQAKLLRVLQEKELTRVGGSSLIKTDCRIITATNLNLFDAVKQGKFREDLFYRLLGLQIELPPLRKRDKDILLLAKNFIDNFCEENNLPEKNLSPQAQTKLLNHSWPGNIRELKSVAELAAVMAKDGTIEATDVLLNSSGSLDSLLSEEKTLEDYNKHIIKHFLKKNNDDVVGVAEKLGIGKSTIYRMMKEDAAFFEKK